MRVSFVITELSLFVAELGYGPNGKNKQFMLWSHGARQLRAGMQGMCGQGAISDIVCEESGYCGSAGKERSNCTVHSTRAVWLVGP